MKRRLSPYGILVAAILAAGCAATAPPEAPDRIAVTEPMLASNLRTLRAVPPLLVELDREFDSLPQPGNFGRDYFLAQEIDEIESWLFRFHAVHTTLWDLVDGYGGLGADFPSDSKDTKAHVLSITATLLMASHTALPTSALRHNGRPWACPRTLCPLTNDSMFRR